MKRTRRMLSFVLALVLCLAMGITAFAANDGSSMAANTAYLQVETAKYNGQPAEIVLVSKELLGDVNKDGDISVSDINTLVNIIMGKGFGNAK